MKVLLDTNIIIHREAASIVNNDIGGFLNGLTIYITLNAFTLLKYILAFSILTIILNLLSSFIINHWPTRQDNTTVITIDRVYHNP